MSSHYASTVCRIICLCNPDMVKQIFFFIVVINVLQILWASADVSMDIWQTSTCAVQGLRRISKHNLDFDSPRYVSCSLWKHTCRMIETTKTCRSGLLQHLSGDIIILLYWLLFPCTSLLFKDHSTEFQVTPNYSEALVSYVCCNSS